MRTARCKRPLSVSFSEDVFNEMKAITDQQQISLAEYIREAVSQQLNHSSTTPSQPGNKE